MFFYGHYRLLVPAFKPIREGIWNPAPCPRRVLSNKGIDLSRGPPLEVILWQNPTIRIDQIRSRKRFISKGIASRTVFRPRMHRAAQCDRQGCRNMIVGNGRSKEEQKRQGAEGSQATEGPEPNDSLG
ncbi:hypothetical protein ACKS0A_08616 [Histoplasma ohiense]